MQISVYGLLFGYGHNVSHVVSNGYLVHAHPFPEIYYFLQGDVDVLLSGVEYHMAPHTLMLYPPGAYHGIRVNSEAPYERVTLHLDPNVLSFERRAQLMAVLPQGGNPAFSLHWPDMESTGILQSLLQLDDCAPLSKPQQKALMPIFIEAVLARMLCHMQDYLPLRQQSCAMPRGQNNHILYYLDEHFTQPISLDMLAERVFVSKIFGHSPSADKRQLAGKAAPSNPEPLDTLRSFVYRATDRQQDTEPTLWSRKAPTLEGFGDPAQLKDDPSR